MDVDMQTKKSSILNNLVKETKYLRKKNYLRFQMMFVACKKQSDKNIEFYIW